MVPFPDPLYAKAIGTFEERLNQRRRWNNRKERFFDIEEGEKGRKGELGVVDQLLVPLVLQVLILAFY